MGQLDPSADPLLVLAVDDHPRIRVAIETILEQLLSARVICVADGASALDAFRLLRFDIVLMDLQMPGMDGYAATREIRRIEAEGGRPRTPVLVVTANTIAQQLASALQAGADEHMAKPITPDGLVAAMKSTIASVTRDFWKDGAPKPMIC
jgi:two-component system, sensor histidine kinase